MFQAILKVDEINFINTNIWRFRFVFLYDEGIVVVKKPLFTDTVCF